MINPIINQNQEIVEPSASELRKLSDTVLAATVCLKNMTYPVAQFMNWVIDSVSVNPSLLARYDSVYVFQKLTSAAEQEQITLVNRFGLQLNFYVETNIKSEVYGYVFRNGRKWCHCEELKFLTCQE